MNELGAFKIMESISYGGAKYRWVAYDALRNPVFGGNGFCNNIAWKIKMRSNYQPRMLAEVVLTHDKREDLRMQFGRALSKDAAGVLNSTATIEPYGLGFKGGQSGKSLISGGNCAFDGGSQPSDGGFTFDLTDLPNDANTHWWFFRLKNVGSNPVTIKSFRIIDAITGSTYNANVLPSPFANSEQYVFIDDGAGVYSGWAAVNFTPAELANPNISGPNADPDGVGASNFLRYALGLPARGAVVLPAIQKVVDGGLTYQQITFTPQVSAFIAYTLESSTDLKAWTSVKQVFGSSAAPITLRYPTPLENNSSPRMFLRLSATQVLTP
jgi:hypothetical protein